MLHQAERITRSATFKVAGEIQNVFPLFGPIREKEWATGWNPEVIFATHPEAELHMIFKTAGTADEPEYLWTITHYNPETYCIVYTVSTANRIWFITVQCESAKTETMVTVTYSYTGLNEIGNMRNREMLQRMFMHDLRDWETAINYYLSTGVILK